MNQSMLCCSIGGGYCRRCDVLVGLPGARAVDAPSGGRSVRIVWRKCWWVCPDPGCPVVSFVEQDDTIAAPRGSLTRRACLWAIGQLRQEHASVNGLRRQLGYGWRTLWAAIKPLLAATANDESRFAGVTHLGVDEHIWHHVSTQAGEAGGRGPKELTGMVDLTPDTQGRTRARLLDLVPGRSGKAYSDWLEDRGKDFRQGVKVATLDPLHGYKNAIDDHLDHTRAVLDAFHVVKLATAAVDEVRRRIQHNTLGRRGRKGDPLYAIRNILRAGQEHLTQRQRTRLQTALAARDEHVVAEPAQHRIAHRATDEVEPVSGLVEAGGEVAYHRRDAEQLGDGVALGLGQVWHGQILRRPPVLLLGPQTVYALAGSVSNRKLTGGFTGTAWPDRVGGSCE